MNTIVDAPAGGGYPAGAPDPSKRSRTKRWHRWGAGAALAGFLAGGGITLAAVSGGGGPATGASGASSASSGSSASSARAARLNTELSAAGNSSPARVRWALGRLRRLGGVEGTVTFRTKAGFRTASFERGTVQSATGSDVVIKSPDGTTWTWRIVSDTVVRKNGAKTTASALSAGQTVFAGGPVANGTRDARLVVIRPDGSAGSPRPPGSQPAGTSPS